MPEQLREALEGAGLDRRAAMEKAFDDLTTSETTDTSTETETPVARTETEGKEEPVVKTTPETPEKTPPKRENTREVRFNARDRRQAGKQATPAPKPGEKPAEGEQPVQPTTHKAPGTWKPGVREKFSALPPDVQEEIVRRESEIARGLNESASARKWANEFGKIVTPYEHLMRASGVTPLQAVGNLVNTAAILQTGTPAQRAMTVANIIKAYGVDLEMLDGILAGQAPAKTAQAEDGVLRAIDERLKPVQEFMSTLQGNQRQQMERLAQESSQTIQEFAQDPKNEFFNDLAEDIADLLELAANRGRVMSMKEAYDLAASQHPEISKVISQRKAAEQAAKDAENLRRSRRAASSQPTGTPGGVGGATAKPGNRKEAIEQAWSDLSSR